MTRFPLIDDDEEQTLAALIHERLEMGVGLAPA